MSLLGSAAALCLSQSALAQSDAATAPSATAVTAPDGAGGGAAAGAAPAGADQNNADGASTQQRAPATDFHQSDGQEIVVTGFRRPREDVLAGTAVLTSEALTREIRPTIGETLARQPGVSATSFGPNASRPVLRGFQGERVRVLTDGIGSLDASATSADHAVAINPLTAERIEVLRGPTALLYGSETIGGVVNVIDARIPRRVPTEAAHVEGLASYGSAANERSINSLVDVPLGGKIVLHLDGNYSKTDDLEIGSYVLSPALRRQALASSDPDVRDLASLKGRLPNSAARTWDVAGGAAYVDGENNVGFSVNHYDSLYGVPIRYSLDPAVEAEQTRIHMRQTRYDGRAEFDLGSGFLDTLRLRAGYADYRHDELEESGDVGTTFLNKGFEGRAEFLQSTRGGWGGGFGAQYLHRNMNVVGEEKFLPKNSSEQVSLFALQSLSRGDLRAEAGARFEHSNARAEADADLGNPALERSFDALSASLGASYGIGNGIRIGLNASHSERAPSPEELFANGPHGGTQAFERGDPDLKVEKSWGLEATLKGTGDGYSFGASVFRSWFSNYIYDQLTGEVIDGLPVFQSRQDRARYFGVELEGSARLATLGAFAINLDTVADYVRATVKDVGPAPRIPPFRILGGIEAQSDRIQGRVEVERVSAQDRLAPFETRTPGYTMVNASLSLKPIAGNQTTILLSANNIFDVDARRHASFLKDFAPLAGRDLRATVRFSF